MTKLSKKVLYWMPRILGIAFATFVILFALDVFGEGLSFSDTAVALLWHLVPAAVVVIALVIGWKRELTGAILFIGLALFYLYWGWGQFPKITYLMMSGPPFLIGVLFLTGWVFRREIKA